MYSTYTHESPAFFYTYINNGGACKDLSANKNHNMPYQNNQSLPKQVKDNVPKHGQDIYREAFNNAHDQYADPDKRQGDESREEAAHRVAWNAVKQKYEKGNDDNWHREES